MKKLLAVLLSVVMVIGACACLTACGGEGEAIEIKVWVSEVEGVAALTEKQIARFNEENGTNIKATIEGNTEADAATQVISSVEDAPDIYCFAQDQTVRLVQAGALLKLGQGAAQTVTSDNDAGSVAAVTVGDTLYAYPLTSDNGYFMYYNKANISEDIIDDLASLVAACETNGHKFSFEIENGWYTASFFFGTGCVSQWTTSMVKDTSGGETAAFTGLVDDFNSEKGLIAMKGMQIVTTSEAYNNSASAADASASIPSDVIVSGTWAKNDIAKAWGDNMGVADLPSFTVGGESYHLGSFSGNKLMGVKPQQDADRAALLQKLALYLTSETCQMERFNQFGWGPSNKKAQASEAVSSDPTLAALAAQNEHATPQGQIEGGWWDVAKNLGTVSITAQGDDALKAALKTYEDTLRDKLVDPDDIIEVPVWGVIGAINGSNWDKDFKMTQDGNVWTSEALPCEEGSEFKLRFNGQWDEQCSTINSDSTTYASGDGSGNAKILVAGTYIFKLDTSTNTISVVPANE